MTKLATVMMTSPKVGIGPKMRRLMLETHNCSFGNSVPASKDSTELAYDFPDAKHIIPMFGYPESWGRLLTTWEAWEYALGAANVYYYNCDRLDEPGSRGENLVIRTFNYGRAYEHNEWVHKMFPGLKTVVTHPFPLPHISDTGYIPTPSDVWAWRFTYIIGAGANWREKWNVPAEQEVWGYWIDEDLRERDLADTGKVCRDLGLSACLIYKAEHPVLMDQSNPDPRTWMTDKARRLLEGMRDA